MENRTEKINEICLCTNILSCTSVLVTAYRKLVKNFCGEYKAVIA